MAKIFWGLVAYIATNLALAFASYYTPLIATLLSILLVAWIVGWIVYYFFFQKKPY